MVDQKEELSVLNLIKEQILLLQESVDTKYNPIEIKTLSHDEKISWLVKRLSEMPIELRGADSKVKCAIESFANEVIATPHTFIYWKTL